MNYSSAIMKSAIDIVVSDEQLSAYLDVDILKQLEERAIRMSFSSGQLVQDVNKIIDFIPIVITGTFKAIRVTESGQEVLMYYLRPNEVCSLSFLCYQTKSLSMYRGVAEEDGELLCVPGALAEMWFAQSTSWRLYMMSAILNQYNSVLSTFEDIGFDTLENRLVKYLSQKAEIIGKKVLTLSHQGIADELGTSRVMVSRMLKKMERDGYLLIYRGQLKLLQKFTILRSHAVFA